MPAPTRRQRRSHAAAAWVSFLAVLAMLAGLATGPRAFASALESPSPVNFSRQILPLLSDQCFSCHGPDEAHRKADLRLDVPQSALASGVIVPGDPKASELMVRIRSSDPEERMPPPESHRQSLTPEQIDRFDRWIREGAPWGRHWAFVPPQSPAVPDRAEHPVDAFVRQELDRQGLEPSPPAPPNTLIRRLSWDLTGLPPTPGEVAAFLADEARGPGAWDRQIARLLASPHYGERMAMWWLDAGRYSDTDGYQGDATRSNWPWRDWVIEAFNANMPFDQFTIEQFAGDLLPEATQDQILATCFHRNHMTNGEGGRDPEESRIDYVIDRVNTTGTVWLGLTLGCAQCHTHKFDPVTHRDYYGMFAFFNSIDEDGKAGGGAKPFLDVRSPYAEGAQAQAERFVRFLRPELERVQSEARARFEPWLEQQRQRATTEGVQAWHPLAASALHSVEGTHLHQATNHVVQATGPNPRQDDYHLTASMPPGLSRITGIRLDVLPHDTHTDGKLSRGASGEFILTDIKVMVRRAGTSQIEDIEVASAVADVERQVKGRNYGLVKDTLDDDPRNGWTTEGNDPQQPHSAIFALEDPLVLTQDEQLVFVMLHRSTEGDANIGRFRVSVTDQRGEPIRSLDPMPLEVLAETRPDSTDAIEPALRERLWRQYLVDDAAYQAIQARYDEAVRQRNEAKRAAAPQKVMVLRERGEPRPTHILERGAWDAKGDSVQPSLLPAILPWPVDRPLTRLDLAHWLVSPENPLTARVIVNHVWQLMMGHGLVRTPEDFGLQGELPTHPDLLDWLAIDLVTNGWDLQRLIRWIVTSDTYRQSSRVDEATLQRDPENRWLARGSRYRLPSWMLRDGALQVAGLLDASTGGPPVYPYQPVGVWREIFMGRFTYRPSVGTAQYRRTLYAFWRRSSAPTFLFDSAQRRVCEIRPRRTNTPLQALTLLNDTTMLEAARALAGRGMPWSGQPADVAQKLGAMFMSVVSRPPDPSELAVLQREYQRAVDYYRTDPADARRLSESTQPLLIDDSMAAIASGPSPERAAATIVASMLLNLDETLTRE